ncbi:MAG: FAD-binding protein [Candidatus Lokiarchaeota archaeon]|nr:FAD-binding protein [Candidatus Lokiarchaeota archaeon]
MNKANNNEIDLDLVVDELSSIVGEKNVSKDLSITIAYSHDQMALTDGPDIVVLPETIDHIKEIMKIASKYKLPVTPKATGANMGGLVIPRYGGILVDLKRLDTIYKIDEENMTATVGPGVSYGQLQIEAWKKNLFIVNPSGPHSVKVIANMTGTRGIGHYAGKFGLGDNQIIGLEVVLPNGKLIKTGCFTYPSGEKAANCPHSPGPDVMGLFLGNFGSMGIIVKAKFKLNPKLEAHDLVVFGGKMNEMFDFLIELVNFGYSNSMLVRWPYICFLFGRSREEHMWMLKNPWMDGFILTFIEGTKKDYEYHFNRLKKFAKEHDIPMGVFGSMIRDNKHLPFIGGGPYNKNDMQHAFLKEPRKLHDFMFESVRILRTRGGFAPHCPFFNLHDAKDIWNDQLEYLKKVKAPLEETCCYCQVVDDGHYVLQEMDVEFNPDPNKMLANMNSLLGIIKPMVVNMFVEHKEVQYYLYADGGVFDTAGPVLMPGTTHILKKMKRLIDPDHLMNRGKGVSPKEIGGK